MFGLGILPPLTISERNTGHLYNVQVVEEMLLSQGHRFETFEDVTKVVKALHTSWECKCVPAILTYAEELEILPPENDEQNSKL